MDWKKKDQNTILHPFANSADKDFMLNVVKGKKEFLYTTEGKKYIDAAASWWVNLHGHANAIIKEKIKKQLDTLEHVLFSGITHKPAILLAEKLLSLTKGWFSKIFYSDNGSTAVEVAIKMALQYRNLKGKKNRFFIAFEGAYHGDTFGAMAVGERDVFVKPFTPQLMSVKFLPLPNLKNFESVKKQFTTLCETGEAAGFIYEPFVQGAGGMRSYNPNYLESLIEIAKKHIVLCIADEVMTGFGRTGKLFASFYANASPDFLCLSKGLTGGYLPMGATLFSKKVANALDGSMPEKSFYHGHSYTANLLSCTAALASLELLKQQQTQVQIMDLYNAHKVQLEAFKNTKGVVKAEAIGTILSVNIQSNFKGYFYLDPINKLLYKTGLANGVLFRPLGNVLYCIPPYCISKDSLQKVYVAMHKCIDATQA